MPGKPSNIPKQAKSLGSWQTVSIATRRPRTGRRACFLGAGRGQIDAPLLLGGALALCSRTPLLVARGLHGAVGRQGGARAVLRAPRGGTRRPEGRTLLGGGRPAPLREHAKGA